jgi:hypothetical protein
MRLKERVSRLARAHGVRTESDEAVLLRRVETLLEQIPTPAIRTLLAACRSGQHADGDSVSEHRVVRQQFAVLLDTGEWPT